MKVWGIILALALAACACCLTASAENMQIGPYQVSFETGSSMFAYRGMATSGTWNIAGIQFNHYMFQYGLNTIEIMETADGHILTLDEFAKIPVFAVGESLDVRDSDLQTAIYDDNLWVMASGKSRIPMPMDAISNARYVGCAAIDLRTVCRVSSIVDYTNPNEFQNIVKTIKLVRGIPGL